MRRTAALLLLGVLVLTSCGDDADSDDKADGAPKKSASATAPPAEPVVVAVGDNDGKDAVSAVISKGQLVYVDLYTCGGCGYEWTVDSAPDATVAAPEETAQPTPTAAASGSPIVGAPTTTRFAFRGVKGGSTKVSIGYHGPAKATADRVVVLTITVKQKGAAGGSAT